MKTLKTDQEVIGQIKLLNEDSFSEPIDSRFPDLVWAKVEARHAAPLQFTLKPVYAVIGLSMIFVLILWVQFYGQFTPSKEPLATEIPIMGSIIEKNGDPLQGEKSSVEEKDFLSTGAKDQITFFLPGVGYFHLAQDSKVEIRKARHVAVPGTVLGEGAGGFQYELFLEEGGLYSQLSKLDSASSLNYLTHFGTVSVSGTDLLLNVEKDSGLSVEVLNGDVMVASSKEPEVYKNVKEGFGALISPHTNGTLLVTELKGMRLAELREQFTQIFKGSERKLSEESTSKLRIVSYREMK